MSSNTGKDEDPHANSATRMTSLLPSGRGGLQPPKSSSNHDKNNGGNDRNDSSSSTTKPKGTSILGLDRLAAAKRQEQQQQQTRNYRRQYNETPSHPGGVNRDVQSRARDRHAGRGGGGAVRQRDRSDNHGYGGSSHDRSRRKREYNRHDDEDDNDHRGSRYQPRRRYEDEHDDVEDRRRRNNNNNNNNDRGGRDEDRRDNRRREDYSRSSGGNNSQRDDSRRDDRRDRFSQPRPRESERRYRGDGDHDERFMDRRRDNERYSGRRPGGDAGGGGGGFSSMPPPPSRASTNTSTRRPPTGGGLVSRPTPGRPPSSSWDTVTPAPRSRDDVDGALNKAGAAKNATDDHDDDSFDRQFYLAEDEGHYVQDAQDGEDLGRFLYDSEKIRAREQEMEQKRQNRMSLRQAARQDDQDAWEENRLRVSGATAQGEVSLDISTEQDTRVTLLVHQVKPPFLDGRVSFSKIRDAVPTVKDASSDFAKMAREGSETLRTLRAKKEKNAMRQKFWELGGTRMGDAVGIKKEKTAESGSGEAETADGEIDYKKSTGFAEHVKSQKDGAVSKFAKEKSIRQQREYLPVFTVRDELLSVIRENNVVIIVGETGSGKVRRVVSAKNIQTISHSGRN